MPKIEVVKQQDLKDCGACSLMCIIKYYNGYVPLEKIRDDTITNMNGTSAYHLIEAAKNYGFDAMGVKVDSIDDKNIYLPAIIHLNLKNGLQHFAVVYKITDKYVYLMDPAIGKVRKNKLELLELWDKVLILFSPINTIINYAKEPKISVLYWNLFLQNKNLFIRLSLLNILLMIVTILSNFYFQAGVSSIEHQKDPSLIKFIVLIFFFIYILKITFEYLKNYTLNFLNKNIDVTLFTSILEHIFHLPLNFIQNRTTGEIVSRIEELNEIKNLATEIFVNLLMNSILIIGAIVVLFMISSKLFLCLCLIVILYLIIGLIFSKVIYQTIKKGILYQTEFNTVLVEHVDMNYSIKNLNLIPKFLYFLESKLIKMLRNNFKLNQFMNKIESSKNFIYEIGLFIVLTYGMFLIYKGDLEVLSLVTFQSLILYLFNPIRELVNIVPRFNYLKASFQKLSDFIAVEKEEDNIGLNDSLEGNIKITDLSYSYNKYTNILNHVNLEINYGEKVLLYGPSGCGKSTLCKLLYRSIKDYTGNIEFHEISEKDLTLSTIRNNILYVGQNERLFTGAIYENIICFRNINAEEFRNVCKICKIEEIVNKRSNRYHTLINASLNNLSGGEKQRIILARALLKKAHILILDEALSEANIEMEKEILDNLFEYYKNETIIYVTHKNVLDKFKKVINLS